MVGTALFASNIGSEHLVGLAGTGYDSGLAVGQFEVLASLILLILGWLFVPFYLRSSVYTMPEFLERRYSPAARWYLAVISIIGYVLTKISVTLYAGGIVYEVLLGGNFWTGALIIVIATGIYTVLGGLRAVLYTEMLQTIVLIGGAILVTVIGLVKLGGVSALRAASAPGTFDMWQPMSHPSFPWTGILFGAPILGVWYWCTDQFIVQRVLSANGIDHARRGTIFGGFLKILPLFIFVIPGVIAAALVKTGQLEIARADHALPEMIRSLLPIGIRGLVMAGFLAALMSSLAAVFNSCSTLITWDIYRKIRPDASERQLVVVGKLATLAAGRLRPAVDPLDEVHLRAALRLPAERSGLHLTTDRRGVSARCLLETGQQRRRHRLSRHRIRARRGATHPGADQGLDERNAPLVRRHQLPALRRVPVRDLHGRPDRREPADATAAGREARRPDLRHRHGRDARDQTGTSCQARSGVVAIVLLSILLVVAVAIGVAGFPRLTGRVRLADSRHGSRRITGGPAWCSPGDPA